MLRGEPNSITSQRCSYILDPDIEPSRNDLECPDAWRAKNTLTLEVLMKRALGWIREQSTLIEAFCVAVSFHVLLFPLIWFAGWALPWPKPPSITTVIEINLEHWPEDARPERIEELYNAGMAKGHSNNH